MMEQTQKAFPTRGMTSQDFAMWGQQDVAYVKRVVVNDEVGWSIHSADGSNIGYAPERNNSGNKQHVYENTAS